MTPDIPSLFSGGAITADNLRLQRTDCIDLNVLQQIAQELQERVVDGSDLTMLFIVWKVLRQDNPTVNRDDLKSATQREIEKLKTLGPESSVEECIRVRHFLVELSKRATEERGV